MALAALLGVKADRIYLAAPVAYTEEEEQVPMQPLKLEVLAALVPFAFSGPVQQDFSRLQIRATYNHSIRSTHRC